MPVRGLTGFDTKESKRRTIPEHEINQYIDEFKYDINNESRDIKNQTICSICHDDFKLNEDVCFIKKCQHLFHTNQYFHFYMKTTLIF